MLIRHTTKWRLTLREPGNLYATSGCTLHKLLKPMLLWESNRYSSSLNFTADQVLLIQLSM